MRFGDKRGEEAPQTPGLDLALTNVELKEEIRSLKEKQNVLLRESLQTQYSSYKLQTELESHLHAQKGALQTLLSSPTTALQIVQKEKENKTARSPEALKENRVREYKTKKGA